MANIQIVLESNCAPPLAITLNSKIVLYYNDWVKDLHGNYSISFLENLLDNNVINIQVADIDKDKFIKVIELIVDDIRFGIVTFLCTTIDGNQCTQLNNPGSIDIKFSAPVWQWWCEMMNLFNYKDYPLGSTN